MGFFSRTKSKEGVEPEVGAPRPTSPSSDISDDYVSPDVEAVREAGGEGGAGAGGGAAASAEAAGEEGTPATSAASLSKSMDGDGYVNAGAAEREKARASPVPSEDYVQIDEAGSFNGVKGTVQPPGYKDVKYAVIFLLHFVLTAWWFLDSFRQVSSPATETRRVCLLRIWTCFPNSQATIVVSGVGFYFMAGIFGISHPEKRPRPTSAPFCILR